jgi:putative lipoic acid-binding regulatory protein
MIKAFGPASESFREGVLLAVRAVVEARSHVSERSTRSGRSVCITLRVQARNVDEVIDVYERLHTVPNLRMIL